MNEGTAFLFSLGSQRTELKAQKLPNDLLLNTFNSLRLFCLKLILWQRQLPIKTWAPLSQYRDVARMQLPGHQWNFPVPLASHESHVTDPYQWKLSGSQVASKPFPPLSPPCADLCGKDSKIGGDKEAKDQRTLSPCITIGGKLCADNTMRSRVCLLLFLSH